MLVDAAELGWAGLGWAWLGWAGLAWAGLAWTGLAWTGLVPGTRYLLHADILGSTSTGTYIGASLETLQLWFHYHKFQI